MSSWILSSHKTTHSMLISARQFQWTVQFSTALHLHHPTTEVLFPKRKAPRS